MEFAEELKTLKEQIKFSEKFQLEFDFDNIVIAGMGGSGIAGKIFQEIYSRKPVITVDDYNIPDFVDERTLFIAISYSGNTEETISAARRALEKGATLFSITTGGMLAYMEAQKIVVPPGLQPRSSIGYMLMPLINTFLPQDSATIKRTHNLLSEMDKDSSVMKEYAAKMWEGKQIPVIYGYSPFKSIAYRWKTQFNENAKVLAYSNYFPELNHNDTMALKDTYRKDEFAFLTFGNPNSERISRRIDATEEITGNSFLKIGAKGDSYFEKLFYLIHFGDYLSYHLSKFRGVDAADVSSIEDLKKKLNS